MRILQLMTATIIHRYTIRILVHLIHDDELFSVFLYWILISLNLPYQHTRTCFCYAKNFQKHDTKCERILCYTVI